MYYSSMGPGAPGNFEGMQRATLGADMAGLNVNTGGQDRGGNPQLAFDPFGSIMDLGRRNFGDLSGRPNQILDPLRRALETGRNNLGSLYRRTDAEYFGGNLPGGSQPPRTFVDTFPKTPGPGFYNMPGAINEIPTGDGFIGPRSIDQLRREALEEIRREDQENRMYSSDPTLAQGLPPDPYPARASGFANKFVS